MGIPQIVKEKNGSFFTQNYEFFFIQKDDKVSDL
jgi:hypothetical protein